MTESVKKEIKDVSLVLLGSLLFAFGVAVFLIPSQLVSGGVSGLAIILTKIFAPIFNYEKLEDLFVFVISWIMFGVGWIFVGKKFSLRTLICTIVEPLLVLLFCRTGIFNFISNVFIVDSSDPEFLVKTLLSGCFGSAFVGIGVGIAYIGGGSTGGFDAFQFIFHDAFGISHSITSFVIDGLIIVIGMFLMDNILLGFIGIISAFVAALMIEFIFVRSGSLYQAEIITEKSDEVLNYVHNVMSRGTTLVEAVGGYTSQKRTLIKVSFDKQQLLDFKTFLAKTDPKAFIILTEVHQVFGEGFKSLYKEHGKK